VVRAHSSVSIYYSGWQDEQHFSLFLAAFVTIFYRKGVRMGDILAGQHIQ